MWCQRCGRLLDRVVWLEFDNSTGTFCRPEMAKESQGMFPFGADCAVRELQDAMKARTEPKSK